MKMTRWLTNGMLAAMLLTGVATGVHADGLKAPTGQTVVTVVGAIDETNRGPFDPVRDAFIGYHEYTFERAAEFDLAMLEALGVQQVAIGYGNWPAPIAFEGPLLTDLLEAVGAHGTSVTAVALDGYAERIAWDELDEYRWILATGGNGRPLGIGGHGPAWLVYDRGAGHRYTQEDEARWPWAVFLIVVE